MKTSKYLSLLMVLILFQACEQKESSENLKQESARSTPEFDPSSLIGKDYLIDDQHSYIGFKIKYFGFSPVRGRFDRFDGTLMYDTANPAFLSTSLYVQVEGINTGNERRDNDLKGEGTWFNADTFPFMSFQSKEVLMRPDGGFDLIGDLTIKGISLEDTFRFEKPTGISRDWAGNEQIDFAGKTVINRQDYKVFGGDFWSSVMENGLTQLSDEVEVEVEIHARRADYQVRYNDMDSTNPRKIILDEIRDNGIESGLEIISGLAKSEEVSPGMVSSIGNTLNTWKMHEEALAIFGKRQELFPKKLSTWNQLGVTYLFLNDKEKAKDCFSKSLENEKKNSWAEEYLRLIDKL